MPYILQADREEFRAIDDLYVSTPGALAYCVARLIRKFMRSVRGPLRYMHYVLVCGVLFTALLEFWRRGVVPYEEEQLRKNGDV